MNHARSRRPRPSRVLAVTAAAALASTVLPLAAGSASAKADDTAGSDRVGRNTIVFQSLRDGNDDIYSVNPDGTGLRRLTDHIAMDAAPAISPDRSAIAFASERDGNSEIYQLDIASGVVTRLTVDDRFDFHPVYSHDGSTILFQRQTGGLFDLWAMNADGTGERQLTTLPANEVGGVYSPNDSRIAFMGNNGGNQDIRVMDADGSKVSNITAGWCTDATADQSPCTLSRELMPTWTPDGRIVFVSTRSGATELWVMNADGSDAQRITHFAGADVRLPAVSANGQRIAFNFQGSLATVKFDGTDPRVLTTSNDLTPAMAY